MKNTFTLALLNNNGLLFANDAQQVQKHHHIITIHE